MTKIRVLSIDYDDCLVPRDFNGSIQQINQKLIASLQQKPYTRTIGFIGSNRQSLRDDLRNKSHNKNLSCYQQIPLFYQHIGVEFDPFLLADAYNNVAAGSSFEQALRAVESAHSGYGCPHDLAKISLIYAQMHKIAGEHPDRDIDFEFFDDKDHIVNDLYDFFAKNRHMIPENINLTCSKYTRETPEAKITLIGSGPINPYYTHYLDRLAAHVLADLNQKHELYDVGGNEVCAAAIKDAQYNGNYQFNSLHYQPLLVSLSDPQLLAMQLAVAQITQDYLSHNAKTSSFSLFHFHGEAGVLRAEHFLNQVNLISNFDSLKKAINEFIMDNKNGNTHPHSYRTMLFHHFYEHGGTEFSLNDAAKKLSAQTQLLSCWNSAPDRDTDDNFALFKQS